jgi:hypothetical protein
MNAANKATPIERIIRKIIVIDDIGRSEMLAEQLLFAGCPEVISGTILGEGFARIR